ncbi:hypothetical protein HDU86_001636 [Geranomyces michiganensis]|nr:hypothetical protein HDU86_001636 [Geranomyces michiganensis]
MAATTTKNMAPTAPFWVALFCAAAGFTGSPLGVITVPFGVMTVPFAVTVAFGTVAAGPAGTPAPATTPSHGPLYPGEVTFCPALWHTALRLHEVDLRSADESQKLT